MAVSQQEFLEMSLKIIPAYSLVHWNLRDLLNWVVVNASFVVVGAHMVVK